MRILRTWRRFYRVMLVDFPSKRRTRPCIHKLFAIRSTRRGHRPRAEERPASSPRDIDSPASPEPRWKLGNFFTGCAPVCASPTTLADESYRDRSRQVSSGAFDRLLMGETRRLRSRAKRSRDCCSEKVLRYRRTEKLAATAAVKRVDLGISITRRFRHFRPLSRFSISFHRCRSLEPREFVDLEVSISREKTSLR